MIPPLPLNAFTGEAAVRFPHPSLALADPDGLLCQGGDLSQHTILSAYAQGVFPWFSEGEPILWWSPANRALIDLASLHISRSLAKTRRNRGFHITSDRCFERVIKECAAPRANAKGTWITDAMIDAYTMLYKMGYAHSVEVWQGNMLAGGLYGLSIGSCFFGESMFSRTNDASKVAFVTLVENLSKDGFTLIDCQLVNTHLASLGAYSVPRENFLIRLEAGIIDQHPRFQPGPWSWEG